MGRRNKDDEVERLEKEVRELKAVNRSLTKRLAKLNKGYRKEREEKGNKPPRDLPTDKEETAALCPACNAGSIVEKQVLDRHWQECTKCNRRTKAKII